MPVNRRDLFKLTGGAAALGVAAPAIDAMAAPPRRRVAGLGALEAGDAISFYYPDEAAPAWLVKMGARVPGGVGPQGDLVAFSALCTHQGCIVDYREGRLICPCHASMFDPARGGQCYQGLADEPLPRIALEVDGDDILATAVEGILWGRRDNLEGGQ